LLAEAQILWFVKQKKIKPDVGVLDRKLSQLTPLRAAKLNGLFMLLCGVSCE
jgi:hypothetical protein